MIRAIRLTAVTALIFLFSYTFAFPEIIKWIDENGITHIENPKNKFESKRFTKRIKGYDYIPSYEGMMEMGTYSDLIEKYAKLNGLDPQLVRAVIKVESNFQRFAKSHKNAAGLMQLIPSTGALYNVYDLYNPEKNIRAGTQHLRFLMDRFNGDLKLVLAAYNAGEKAVDAYKGIPPYRETTNYIDKVIRYYEYYANKPYTSLYSSIRTPSFSKVRAQRINNVLYITNVKR